MAAAGASAEESGFAGLYRSDHFTEPEGPHLDALELWTSLTWLATNTSRISFGPVVAPVSFRDPRIAAWQAAAIHALAPGRLRFGLGAGWMEREHEEWGFDLLGLDARFQRFTEALVVVTRLLRSDGPVSFSGEFYELNGAELEPNPRVWERFRSSSAATASGVRCRWRPASRTNGTASTSLEMGSGRETGCSMTSCARRAGNQVMSAER